MLLSLQISKVGGILLCEDLNSSLVVGNLIESKFVYTVGEAIQKTYVALINRKLSSMFYREENEVEKQLACAEVSTQIINDPDYTTFRCNQLTKHSFTHRITSRESCALTTNKRRKRYPS